MAEQDNTTTWWFLQRQASCSFFLSLFLGKEELSNRSQLALLQPLHTLVRPNLHATTPTLMEETRVYQVYWHFGNVSCRGQKIQLKDPDFRTGYKKTWDWRGTLCNFNQVGMILIFLGPALSWRLTQGFTLPHPDAAETGSSTLSMTLQGRGGVNNE